ncbi:MAG TPA: copper resistance CopC family protein [Phototrophicaceae bacterium]|nr:copper resistance CopC family protein [Phototrophicaceae bacterium]
MTPVPSPLRRARAVVAALLLVVLTGALVPAAQAHDVLVESQPAADAVLEESPDAVVLTFNNPPLAVGSAITVVDVSGAVVAQGEGTVEGNDVVLPLGEPLPSGDLEVRWRVASSDGHPIEGTFGFTLDAPAAEPSEPVAPTTAATTTAPAAPESSGPTAGVEATSAAADEAEEPANGLAGLPTWLKVAIGVAALGAVAGLVVLVVKRLREDRA